MNSLMKHIRKLRSRRGLTLVEIMIAVVILSIIIYYLYNIYNDFTRIQDRGTKNSAAQRNARDVIHRMVTEMREAGLDPTTKEEVKTNRTDIGEGILTATEDVFRFWRDIDDIEGNGVGDGWVIESPAGADASRINESGVNGEVIRYYLSADSLRRNDENYDDGDVVLAYNIRNLTFKYYTFVYDADTEEVSDSLLPYDCLDDIDDTPGRNLIRRVDIDLEVNIGRDDNFITVSGSALLRNMGIQWASGTQGLDAPDPLYWTSDSTSTDTTTTGVIENPGDNDPWIDIIFPEGGDYVAGEVIIEAEAVDPDYPYGWIKYVEFFIDDILIYTDYSSPFRFTYDFTSYTDGATPEISAKVTDNTEAFDTDEITVIVNNTCTDNIEINIVKPVDGDRIIGATETIKFEAFARVISPSDGNHEIDRVEFYIRPSDTTNLDYGFIDQDKDDQDNDDKFFACDEAGDDNSVLDLAYYPTGDYYFYVQAWDNHLCMKDTTIEVRIVNSECDPSEVDLPVVTIVEPLDGNIVTETTTITATASDATGITRMKLYINSQEVADTMDSNTITYEWNTRNIACNGAFDITAEAIGGTDCSAEETITVNVDNTGPQPQCFSDDFESMNDICWSTTTGTWEKVMEDGSMGYQLILSGDRRDFAYVTWDAPENWIAKYRMKWTSGSWLEAGLLWNHIDEGNYYLFQSRDAGIECQRLQIKRNDYGDDQSIVVSIDDHKVSKNIWYYYKIIKSEDTYSFYMGTDGVEYDWLMEYEDPSPAFGDQIGFGAWTTSTTVIFDDFEFCDVCDDVPSVVLTSPVADITVDGWVEIIGSTSAPAGEILSKVILMADNDTLQIEYPLTQNHPIYYNWYSNTTCSNAQRTIKAIAFIEDDYDGEPVECKGQTNLNVYTSAGFVNYNDDFDDDVLDWKWNIEDIGYYHSTNHIIRGTIDEIGGQLVVEAAGSDIYNEDDYFRYIYQEGVCGDFDIWVRVLEQENTNDDAKAGVMIRDNLDTDSPTIQVVHTANNQIQFQRRTTTGASIGDGTSVNGILLPCWVRLKREGNAITGYYSTEETPTDSWESITTYNDVELTDPVYIGLAACSHEADQLGTVKFDNFGCTYDYICPAPSFPVVEITNPLDGSILSALTDIEITVSTIPEQVIEKTELYLDGALTQTWLPDTSLANLTYPNWYTATTCVDVEHIVKVIAYTSDATGGECVSNETIYAYAEAGYVDFDDDFEDGVIDSKWYFDDIGYYDSDHHIISGTEEETGGQLVIEAAGRDIYDNDDYFRYVYQGPVCSDFKIWTRITEQEYTNDYAKAGIMIRDNLATDSPTIQVVHAANNEIQFQRRTTTGASIIGTDVSGISLPCWVQLERVGDDITGYYSIEETPTNWQSLATYNDVALNDPVYIGLAASSHEADQLCTVKFDEFGCSYEVSSPYNDDFDDNVLDIAKWSHKDVGAVSKAGDVTEENQQMSVYGSGKGIAGTEDEFHFLYQEIADIGDFALSVQIVSHERIDGPNLAKGAKIGIMVRDDLIDNSSFAMMVHHYDTATGLSFQRRQTTGGSGDEINTNTTIPDLPYWVKLERDGNTILSYHSPTGEDGTWTFYTSDDLVELTSPIYFGLVITSKADGKNDKCVFDNFKLISK